MRGLAIALILTVVVLAGCADKADQATTSSTTSKASTSTSGSPTGAASGTGTATGTTSAPSSSGGSTTTGAGTATNHAPTATLTAANATGSIPFNVTFQVRGSDADNDTLSYNLTFGDGSAPMTGTLPANVTHAYTLVGNFTAMLVVSDGKESVNTTLIVHVLAAAVAGGTVTQDFTGAWNADDPGTCEAGPAYPAQASGVTYQKVTVKAGTQGEPFTATFKGDPTNGFPLQNNVEFFDAAGSSLAFMADTDSGQSYYSVVGNVPAGAASIYFSSCATVPGMAGVTYHAGP